jgi:alpha-L-rhamnosidase
VGILANAEWKARWIEAPSQHPVAAAPLFRKEISLERPVRRAIARIASLGWSELTIDGHTVADSLLGPPFTDSERRILYDSHDVTGALAHPGAHVLGVTIGNGHHSPPAAGGGPRPDRVVVEGGSGTGYHNRFGRYGPPAVLLEIQIEYADGTTAFVGSDSSWSYSAGPVTFNDLWQGEKQDRRADPQGWQSVGYDASQWQTAVERVPPHGRLEPNEVPPIRQKELLTPDKVEGDVATFSRVGAGWPRIEVDGVAGQKIVVSGQVGDRFALPHLEFILRG